MNVTLPWFVLPNIVDYAIMNGGTVDLDVVCTNCGSWGDYGTWSTGPNDSKLCPKCGSYATEKVGNK